MDHGTQITIVVACISTAMILYSISRMWRDGLLKREATIKRMKDEGLLAHRQAIDKNFVLCDLWRLSHIYAFAKDEGVVLDHTDCLAVIAIVRRDFNARDGVTRRVIINAIRAHVKHRREMDKILAEQL